MRCVCVCDTIIDCFVRVHCSLSYSQSTRIKRSKLRLLSWTNVGNAGLRLFLHHLLTYSFTHSLFHLSTKNSFHSLSERKNLLFRMKHLMHTKPEKVRFPFLHSKQLNKSIFFRNLPISPSLSFFPPILCRNISTTQGAVTLDRGPLKFLQ